jgi:transcription initiation factor TFIID subunit 5
MLATGGEDRRIRIWDLAASNVIKELKGHTDTVYSLTWSPDSSLLSSGAIAGTLRLWDVKGPTYHSRPSSPSFVGRH